MSTRAAAAATRLVLRCPICWDSVSNPTLTPCGHRFCGNCIRTALGIKLECPTCRQPVSSHRALRADSHLAAAAGSELPARSLCAEQGESADDVWLCGSCKCKNPTAAGRCSNCSARRPALALPRVGPRYVEEEEEEEENLSDAESFGSDWREEEGDGADGNSEQASEEPLQIAGSARLHGSLQVGGSTPAQPAIPRDQEARAAADGDERAGADDGLQARGAPPYNIMPLTGRRKKCEHCTALNPTAQHFCVACGARFNIEQNSAGCLACAGRHRPHTCIRGAGRQSRPSLKRTRPPSPPLVNETEEPSPLIVDEGEEEEEGEKAEAAGEVVKQVDGVRLHLSRRSSTGYSGVYPRSGRFQTQLRTSSDGKQTTSHTGTYDTAVEAAVAYAKHWIAVGGTEPKEEEMDGYRLVRSHRYNSSTGYSGVYLRWTRRGEERFLARPRNGIANGIYLGMYDTAVEAAVAVTKHIESTSGVEHGGGGGSR